MVRINVTSGEVSIEGSEDFVSKELDRVVDIISSIRGSDLFAEDDEEEISQQDRDSEEKKLAEIGQDKLTVPESFGEWLHCFKKELTDLDQALITAYFIQKKSPQNEFKTSEVNDALKEHGIKLTNPSQSLKRLSQKQFMFQVRKSGKLSFKRVSADGVEHLKSILK